MLHLRLNNCFRTNRRKHLFQHYTCHFYFYFWTVTSNDERAITTSNSSIQYLFWLYKFYYNSLIVPYCLWNVNLSNCVYNSLSHISYVSYHYVSNFQRMRLTQILNSILATDKNNYHCNWGVNRILKMYMIYCYNKEKLDRKDEKCIHMK